MKKRNLNILASLVIALALTGCNESEVDKITLIGQDKRLLRASTKPSLKNEHQTSKPSLCSIKLRLKARSRIPLVD